MAVYRIEVCAVLIENTEPQLPMDLTGRTFKRVFGTNTSAFELFLIKRKIMGPCWLEIKNAELSGKGVSLTTSRLDSDLKRSQVSWCKLEVRVRSPKHVNPFKDSDHDAPKDMPPLTVMSLSLRTIVNHKENKREIICATARVWQDCKNLSTFLDEAI